MIKPSLNWLDAPKLNLGCGPVQPEGWLNVDGSNRAFLASKLFWLDNLLVRLGIIPPTEHGRQTRYHNLLQGLPYRDNSIGAIYAGELWEHFEYEDALALTRECYRVLMQGGVLRVCVPDEPSFWGKYLEIHQAERSKTRESRNVERLRAHVQLFFDDICTRRTYLGSMGHFHKWGFDDVQLVDMFERGGFSNVERMSFLTSRIPRITEVERSDFLIVEGIKK